MVVEVRVEAPVGQLRDLQDVMFLHAVHKLLQVRLKPATEPAQSAAHQDGDDATGAVAMTRLGLWR